MAENQPLSLTDMESISEAVFYLISQYGDMPFTVNAKTLQWQNLSSEEGIGVFSMQGGIYLSRYVSGSYTAQFPFRIIYKCKPTNSKSRMTAQQFVENLSKWLEECSASFTDTHTKIQSIERTSPVFKQQADDSGYEQYTCTLSVKYSYIK